MAEISSPFVGITRIRFKGSSNFADLSARRLPRSIEIKSHASEVNPPRTGSQGTITADSSDDAGRGVGAAGGEVFAGVGDDE